MIGSNTKFKQQGFTIVELLVVIVVIGILSAITIVSYSGVTNKAKDSTAKAQADAIKTAAGTYNALKGNYPFTKSALTTASATDGISQTIGDIFGTPSATDATKVAYYPCGAATPTSEATTTGFKVIYFATAGNITELTGTTTACSATSF